MQEEKTLSWFRKLARKNGWHPRLVIASPKVVGKMNVTGITEEFLRRAVRETYQDAIAYTEKNNAKYRAGKEKSFVVIDEREWLIAGSPNAEPPILLGEGDTMKVAFADAVDLLGALGCVGVRSWPAAEVREKFCNLDRDYISHVTLAQLTEQQRQLYQRLIDVLTNKRDVVRWAENGAVGNAGANGHAAPPAAPKTQQQRANARQQPTTVVRQPKPAGGGVDRWGNRLGSQAALINVCIGEAPKTVEQMCKETGLGKSRVAGHMSYLLGRGLIVQDENGCRVRS